MEVDTRENDNVLTRIALKLTGWMEKWFPDAFVFVLLAVVFTAGGALGIGASPIAIAKAFGDGFWDLISFTLQASLVVIGGYVVASSPIAARTIRSLAGIPRTGPSAVAFIATVSCVTSLLNWAFSLVFSALLVREIARRNADLDYRAASAAAILGLGSVWALGLSSAPAQLQANAGSLPPALLRITGVIPFSETIFLWQSIVMLCVLLIVSITVAYLSTPRGANAMTAQSLGIDLNAQVSREKRAERPGEWLECNRLLPMLIVGMAAVYLGFTMAEKGILATISNLNTYNFLFLALGLLLHGTPRRFTRAVSAAVPSVSGVLIQFPFYAGVAAILTHAANSNGLTLATAIAHAFTSFSGQQFAPAVGVYSAVLGVLIPSGGGKWLVEAPYVMQAANNVHAHLGWVVQIYNAAEALPNLINPFWMIPVLGLVSLKARDIVGFSFLQFLINTPLVLFMAWFFAGTLHYHQPVFP
nr:TIGR00366 family protein [Paraburkholderia sartisoli]